MCAGAAWVMYQNFTHAQLVLELSPCASLAWRKRKARSYPLKYALSITTNIFECISLQELRMRRIDGRAEGCDQSLWELTTNCSVTWVSTRVARFKGSIIAASVQIYRSYILGKHQKSRIMFKHPWALTRDTTVHTSQLDIS